MDVLSKAALKALSEKHIGPHVSLYAPTHRAGPETQQDPIRLKNLVKEAGERLVAGGLRAPDAKELLRPAEQLVQDGLFWRHQSDGLAIFLSSDFNRYYRLPLEFEELVVVAERFHVKPLLPLLSGDGRFYILALSQDKVRLLRGSRDRVSDVELEGVPSSLAEALRLNDPERQLQFHTATGPSGGKGSRAAAFHGHGGVVQDDKVDILRYFHKVDDGLRKLLAGEQAPLMLAGVDYLLPLYREANTYPHLIEAGIEGNPDNLSAEELHQQAWAIVQPRFLEERIEAAKRFRQFADTDQASDDLAEVVPAAYHGRVETLFVALDLQQWGTFDPATNEVQLHQDTKPGDQDLLDSAAVQTLLNGGSVYAVEPEQMPVEAPLAALLRY
jgi:hypothetical protein